MKLNHFVKSLVACAVLSVASAASAADTIELRFSNATNQAAKDAALVMIDVAKKESNGVLDIKHFPDNMLGDDRVATESTIMGDIDLVLTQPSVLTSMVSDFYMWDAPFLFSSADDARACFNGEVAQKINSQVESKGLKYLAMVGNGFRNYTNNKVAVKVPADVKGAKVRVIESEIQMAQWQAWGANPTPMAFAEVLPALQQGTIDAQENPVAIIDANKLYEVQHYISLTGHQYSPQILIMNKDKYESLSPELQAALDKAVKAFVDTQVQRSKELDAKAVDKFKQAGCEVIELSDADREQWKKMAVDGGVYDLVKDKMEHPEYLDSVLVKKY